VAIQADAASTADAERVMQCAIDNFGGLDILVNNAGLFPARALLDIDEALWDRVHNVNLRGLFFYSQAAAKHMIAQGRGGNIVNIASVSGMWPTCYLAHYDASKGGVIMLTKSLAKELGAHGIRVNAVAPGGIATPGGIETASQMLAVLNIPEGTEMPTRAVIGRNAEADDIARAVFFLASDLAAAITGITLPVEAGYLLA
jgi:glucose 1-dehydrogenase/2-deoxy-D-gluconate 3-dehydrogenase